MKNIIKPKRLQFGDTIGIIAPSYAQKPEYIEEPVKKLRSLGFRIKLSTNIFSSSNGFSGSIKERADDFNSMVSDDSIKMILFGGGEVCNEILPDIDYANVLRHPKIFCSYSDSTTILNAIHYMTGLVTFYGASLHTFDGLTEYNWQSFTKLLMTIDTEYIKNSVWKAVCPGECEGILTGGYLVNYAALQGLDYYKEIPGKRNILFIEDHETFSSPAVVSKWFSNLEHRGVFKNVTGLIFGHYSNEEQPLIDDILFRIGDRYRIPVVRCEDFGHGVNNTVLPIGIRAKLDTSTCVLKFCESGVI